MAISGPTGTWSIGDNWPWPRLFITDYYVLAVAINGTHLSLYELINASDIWTATEVADLGTVTAIDNISIASFEKYYMIAVSGYDSSDDLWTQLIQRKPLATAALTATEAISSGTIPHGTAICNYKNQLIIGGLNSNNIKWQSLGRCAVAYSGIGNTIFDPGEDHSSGFLKMPWDIEGKGKIYQIEKLKDIVIIYGNLGIEKLTPFQNEKITGFGQETVWSTGLLGPNCVGGSIKGHCFIDANYDLCLLTDQIENLGYRRFMQSLDPDKTIISYENKKQFFYISDDSFCYILTPHGLYSTHQCVSSVGNYNNIICGFTKNGSDTKVRLATTEFDLGYQSLKSLESVAIGIDYQAASGPLIFPDIFGSMIFGEGSGNEIYMKLYTKYDYKKDMIDLNWIRLNDLGILSRRITGRSFKIAIQTDYNPTASINISPMRLNIQYADKRNIRSKYAY